MLVYSILFPKKGVLKKILSDFATNFQALSMQASIEKCTQNCMSYHTQYAHPGMQMDCTNYETDIKRRLLPTM